ncbi:MAG TPA: hypothetical protein VLH38_05650 [Patescibacteria group bacterium]|nr:hypothetical protein [Patescibacteria group bacterium]
MVKDNKSKLLKVSLIVVVITILLGGITLAILSVNKKDAIRLKEYKDAATVIGIARAKQECRREGLSAEVCDSITGAIDTSECSGMTCWIVYARSRDPNGYGASITINKQNDRYIVIDYLRDTGTHQ